MWFFECKQFLACSAKNLVVFDFGLGISFPTILIPALTGLNSELNQNETLTISPEQATWMGIRFEFRIPIQAVWLQNIFSQHHVVNHTARQLPIRFPEWYFGTKKNFNICQYSLCDCLDHVVQFKYARCYLYSVCYSWACNGIDGGTRLRRLIFSNKMPFCIVEILIFQFFVFSTTFLS